MYVFGGNDALKNDLCLEILNFETCRWENPIISGDQPCGRRSHCCWVYNDKMYIFGGYQHTRRQHLNTLHEFNPETSRWRYLELNGLRCPIARQRHCAVVVNNRVFLFGGLTPVIHWSVPIDVECLVEICDLHVLSYELKLKDLCVIALQKNKPNDEILNMLPYDLRFDLRMMTTTNPVS
uniref:Kelch domain-containing protein 10 n=1 Tax=Setaria digitata TaxID=48799 RepID=A0A915Q3Y3_9BILA